jgi:hypothetical protein
MLHSLFAKVGTDFSESGGRSVGAVSLRTKGHGVRGTLQHSISACPCVIFGTSLKLRTKLSWPRDAVLRSAKSKLWVRRPLEAWLFLARPSVYRPRGDVTCQHHGGPPHAVSYNVTHVRIQKRVCLYFCGRPSFRKERLTTDGFPLNRGFVL